MNHKFAPKSGRDLFRKVHLILNVLSGLYRLFPLSVRVWLLEHHRKTRGKFGLGIRYSLLRTIAKSCGNNVSIHPDVYLLNPQNLSIASNVSIHPMCYLDAVGYIDIGENVSIAHGVSIISANHSYSDSVTPIKYQPIMTEIISISENVWIGAQAILLSGVRIESGCIIAAGAVVTRSTTPDSVYAGVPARIIKDRYRQ